MRRISEIIWTESTEAGDKAYHRQSLQPALDRIGKKSLPDMPGGLCVTYGTANMP